ncbi:MAG: hypothetical protein SNG27_04730 [Rikenellaceae bacterium]
MRNEFSQWKDNEIYFKMLGLLGSLSNLFSESKIPFIHYRITENLFCKYFGASNLSRSDISYDAKFHDLGVGIKTFQLKNGGTSIEKVAEFNQLSPILRSLKGENLARKVSELRNERIDLANTICGTSNSLYHIIGRQESELLIYNTSYDKIDVDNIRNVKSKSDTSVRFDDEINEYTFNYSKSVLMKRFEVSSDKLIIPIEIIEDPYIVMERLLGEYVLPQPPKQEFVILPLFSQRQGGYVPDKSGLNQWNAEGRKRDENEVYIAIPKKIHENYPNFFPDKETQFNLHLPNDQTIIAKLCQAGAKALMSNPNSALGEWLLRDLMKLPVGKLATMADLNRLGFDSVIITKEDSQNYKISVSYTQSYRDF